MTPTSERLVGLAERLEEWSRGCQPESPLIITASLVQNIAAELRAMAGEDDEMDAWRVQAVDELRELHLALATAIAERDEARAAVDGRQVLPPGWHISVGRGIVPEIIFITINGPQCTMGIQCGDRDVQQGIAEKLEKALASVGGEAGGGGG